MSSVLSLCSGIGGLELSLPAHWQVVANAEISAAPSSVLRSHWPDTPNLGDWTQLDILPSADVLIGGLPCQPFSNAGVKRGVSDKRYLFDYLLMHLQRKTYSLVLLENVAAFKESEARTRLVTGLMSLGYSVREVKVTAAEIGAPHKRARYFLSATLSDGIMSDLLVSDNVKSSANLVKLPTPLAEPNLAHKPEVPKLPNVLCNGPKAMGRVLTDEEGRLLDWKEYQEAIDLWASILGRHPPHQIVASERVGKKWQLVNPVLVEWLMGFPESWSKEIITTSSRLKALGNACMPQQARLAWSRLAKEYHATLW